MLDDREGFDPALLDVSEREGRSEFCLPPADGSDDRDVLAVELLLVPVLGDVEQPPHVAADRRHELLEEPVATEGHDLLVQAGIELGDAILVTRVGRLVSLFQEAFERGG
jgi:hypothetical protein